MTKTEYLKSLQFYSFEKYPQQMTAIYLKCESVDMETKEYVCKFIRVNQFNAMTFDPKEVIKMLGESSFGWWFSWLPALEIDELYG